MEQTRRFRKGFMAKWYIIGIVSILVCLFVLSVTFIASWWGAGSAISTADLAYSEGLGAFWYYGVPVLIATFLMMLGGCYNSSHRVFNPRGNA